MYARPPPPAPASPTPPHPVPTRRPSDLPNTPKPHVTKWRSLELAGRLLDAHRVAGVGFKVALESAFPPGSVVSAYQILLREVGLIVALAQLSPGETAAVGGGIVCLGRLVGQVESEDPLDRAGVFVVHDTASSLMGDASEVELVNSRGRAVSHRLRECRLYVLLSVNRILANVPQRLLLVLPLKHIVLHQRRVLGDGNSVRSSLDGRLGLGRQLVALSLQSHR